MGIPKSLIDSDIPAGAPWEREQSNGASVVKASTEDKKPDMEGESAFSMFAKRAAKSFGEQMGRNDEARVALINGEAYPVAFLRTILPSDWVDKISPSAQMGIGKDARKEAKDRTTILGESATVGMDEALRKLPNALKPKVGGKEEAGPDIGPAESGWGVAAGHVGDFVGSGAGMPVQPGVNLIKQGGKAAVSGLNVVKEIAKDAFFNANVGTASAAVGEASGNIADAMGASPETSELVKKGGEFGGALAGGLRSNVISTAAEGAAPIFRKGKQLTTSVSDAVLNRRKDQRDLQTIINEDMNTLDASVKGKLQDRVVEQIARDIKSDINQPKSTEEFAKAAKALGYTPEQIDQFSIAQQVATPNLVGTIKHMRPENPEQLERLAEHAVQRPTKLLADTSQRITENAVKADSPRLHEQLNAFRNQEVLKIQAIEAKALDDINGMVGPELNADSLVKQGEKIGEVYEKQHSVIRDQRNKNYEEAKAIDAKLGTNYDITPATEKVKDILKQTLSVVDPSTVPESLRKLKNLVVKNPNDVENIFKDIDITQMTPENQQWVRDMKMKQTNTPTTLKDINEVLITLHDDIAEAAFKHEGTTVRNLKQVEEAIKDVIQTQAPKEVIEAYNKAVAYHRDTYVPMFKQGYGFQLSREAPISREGHSLIDPQNRINVLLKKDSGSGLLSETALRDFDNTFGGKIEGTQRIEEAYTELARGIEGKYQKDVIKNNGVDGFDPKKHEQFMKENEPAIKRVPEIGKKLDQAATLAVEAQMAKKRIEERFKYLTSEAPIGSRFNQDQAHTILTHALSDPRKMGQLVSSLGKGEEGAKGLLKEISLTFNPIKEVGGITTLDPAKLGQLLKAGRVGEDGIGGLQVLSRSAFGKAEGDAHIERLKSLLFMMERVKMTEPKALRPDVPIETDIAENALGQSTAGIISRAISFSEGRVGAPYLSAVVGSRFLNSKVKEKFNEAFLNVLFDPKYSKAAMELAKSSKTIPKRSTLEILLGNSKDIKGFLDQLVSEGLINGQLYNATRTATAVSTNKDEKNQSRRVKKETEPFAARLSKGEK